MKSVKNKTVKQAQRLGKHGDSILAHINPNEAALLRARGGVGTRNPSTGLPQFYAGGAMAAGNAAAREAASKSNSGGGGLGSGGTHNASNTKPSGPLSSTSGDLTHPVDGHSASLVHDPVTNAYTGDNVNHHLTGQKTNAGLDRTDYETSYGAPVRYDPKTNTLTALPEKSVPGKAQAWSSWKGQLDAYNEAAKQWNSDLFKNSVINTVAPLGLEQMAPRLENPGSYVDGTYHTGWNPGSAIGGLAGSAVGGPLGGLLAGWLGGQGYSTFGGKDVRLGGGDVPGDWSGGTVAPGASAPGFGGLASSLGLGGGSSSPSGPSSGQGTNPPSSLGKGNGSADRLMNDPVVQAILANSPGAQTAPPPPSAPPTQSPFILSPFDAEHYGRDNRGEYIFKPGYYMNDQQPTQNQSRAKDMMLLADGGRPHGQSPSTARDARDPVYEMQVGQDENGNPIYGLVRESEIIAGNQYAMRRNPNFGSNTAQNSYQEQQAEQLRFREQPRMDRLGLKDGGRAKPSKNTEYAPVVINDTASPWRTGGTDALYINPNLNDHDKNNLSEQSYIKLLHHEMMMDDLRNGILDKNQTGHGSTPFNYLYATVGPHPFNPRTSDMASGGYPRQPIGQVRGPGGPKSDMVGPIMLSNKEYVMPEEMVRQVGGGSYNKGLGALEARRKALVGK